MPSGIYHRTEYHRKITSDGIKNFIRENPGKGGHFKKGHIPWNTNLILGPYSDVRKENIRISHIGLKYPNRKEYSQQAIENIAKGNKRKWEDPIYREKLSGKNSHLWHNGISFEKYTRTWTNILRTKIRTRDNNICQICDVKSKDILHTVHHIDYDKKNNNTNNLITLCKSCHQKTNFNRENWKLFFNNMMNIKILKEGSETIIRTPEWVMV